MTVSSYVEHKKERVAIMRLYKNVDIKDLQSILDIGILSLNKSGNNNWNEGKRANNSCDNVYLFKKVSEENSFCQYGVALLEICIPDEKVRENALFENDVNRGRYIEYVADEVQVEYITAIYIPELFKKRIDLSEDIMSKITWCDMKANHYGSDGKENCPNEVLEQFAKTAKIFDTSELNFFRGKTVKREMIDLYDVEYVL